MCLLRSTQKYYCDDNIFNITVVTQLIGKPQLHFILLTSRRILKKKVLLHTLYRSIFDINELLHYYNEGSSIYGVWCC